MNELQWWYVCIRLTFCKLKPADFHPTDDEGIAGELEFHVRAETESEASKIAIANLASEKLLSRFTLKATCVEKLDDPEDNGEVENGITIHDERLEQTFRERAWQRESADRERQDREDEQWARSTE